MRKVQLIQQLLVAFGLVICTKAYTQQLITDWEFTNSDVSIITVFEEFDHSSKYLLVSKPPFLQSEPPNKLMILDHSGKMLLWRNLGVPDFDVLFLDSYYDKEKGRILLMGVGTNVQPFDYNKYNHFVTCWVDEEGKIYDIKTTLLESAMGYRSMKYLEEKDNLKIVISSDLAFLDFPGTKPSFETVFLEIDKKGDVRKYTYLASDDYGCQCLLPSLHSYGYHCPGIEGYNLDDDLNIIGTEFDRVQNIFLETRWIEALLFWLNKKCYLWGKDQYLIANNVTTDYNSKLRKGRTGVFTYSTKDYKLRSYEGVGRGMISFVSQTMDITADSMIYTGNYGAVVHVAKLDKNLNKLWELEFVFENKRHHISGIKSLSDGGAVIYGYRYPQGLNTQGNPFVVKFDSNGGVSHTDELKVTAIKTYPNPSPGPLQIDIQGMTGVGVLRVFDLLGRNVYVHNGMQNGSNTIDISDLSAGTYHYKLYLGNKEIHSGTWVKM